MSSHEHGNEPSCSVKRGEFFDLLSGYRPLRKDSIALLIGVGLSFVLSFPCPRMAVRIFDC
jgi:hypothetical protein